MKKRLFSGLALLALTACQTIPEATSPSQVIPPTANQAAQVFDQACVRHSPNFQGSYLHIAKTGQFTLDQESGIYFHNYIDLSVFVHVLEGNKVCTLVFYPEKANAKTSQEALSFFTKKTGASPIERYENGIDGRVYNINPEKTVYIDISEDRDSLRLLVSGTQQ